MAGWRRAVELTMTDEEIERLTVLFLQVRPLEGKPANGLYRTACQRRAAPRDDFLSTCLVAADQAGEMSPLAILIQLFLSPSPA